MVKCWKHSFEGQEQDKNEHCHHFPSMFLLEVLVNVIRQKIKIKIGRKKQNCHCSNLIFVETSQRHKNY